MKAELERVRASLKALVEYHDSVDCWHVNEYTHTCDSNPANDAAAEDSPIQVARRIIREG